MKKSKSINVEIGARIQKARKNAHLTQMAFAEKIDVSTQYVSDLERGVVGASISTIIKRCETLNVSTDYILRGVDPATQQPADYMIELQQFSPKNQQLILDSVRNLYQAFSSK